MVVAGLAVAAWLGWTALLLPVQIVAVGLDLELARRVPILYHRGVCWLFGVTVTPSGQISPAHPTLFVANHTSYLDISVLGGLLRASFIAKQEIRGWPLLGLLARLQRSVFIDRRIAGTRTARAEVTRRLAAGDDLILFAEGTTGDGNRLLPFRSAFLGLATDPMVGRRLLVQPVTLAYLRHGGLPLGHAGRPRLAWYGDMALARHFWQAVRDRGITVAVRFHPPVEAARFADRKALTDHCFVTVAAGLAAALHGHGDPLTSAGRPPIDGGVDRVACR